MCAGQAYMCVSCPSSGYPCYIELLDLIQRTAAWQYCTTRCICHEQKVKSWVVSATSGTSSVIPQVSRLGMTRNEVETRQEGLRLVQATPSWNHNAESAPSAESWDPS